MENITLSKEEVQSLLQDAKDFESSISHWEDYEIKGGHSGHKIVKMRPILIAKEICKKIKRYEQGKTT